MEKLKQSHGVTIQWRSFELRPEGSPPISPDYRARIEAARPQLYARAREEYGLELNVGPSGINSRPALVGAKFAESHGLGDAYNKAVFRAYWQDAKNIGDTAVLGEIAEAVGLERQSFLDSLDDPEYQQAMLGEVAQARAYGLNSVPALVYNNKYLVSGAQPYEVLTQVAEQVASESPV